MVFFDVVLQTRASLSPPNLTSDFISEYVGYIYRMTDDDRSIKVGKVRAYRIHAGMALNHGVPLFDVCDDHSQELRDVYDALYNRRDDSFRQRIADRFDAIPTDCLVLDYIVLHPRWRGLKIGLLAARRLMDLLGDGCGLTVSEIYPLSPEAQRSLHIPESWIPRHESKEQHRQATVGLRRYFRRLGFKRLGRTPFYGLSMAHVVPTAAELLKPEYRAKP